MSRNPVQTYHPQQLIERGSGGGLAELAAQQHARFRDMLTAPIQRFRSIDDVKKSLRTMALASGKVGTDGKQNVMFYAWPVRNKKTGKTSIVKGPSIKCAELIQNMAGNCASGTSVGILEDAFVFDAWFLDRETGVVTSRLFRQHRNQMTAMGDDAERQEDITFQIGQSKALRNVITRGLPELCDYAVDEAERQLTVTIEKDKRASAARIMSKLAELGVPAERVAVWIGRGQSKWSTEDLVKISAALVALDERTASIEDIWPNPAIADGPPPAPRPAAKTKAKADRNEDEDLAPPATDKLPDA